MKEGGGLVYEGEEWEKGCVYEGRRKVGVCGGGLEGGIWEYEGRRRVGI
jgi:hypothetical protein